MSDDTDKKRSEYINNGLLALAALALLTAFLLSRAARRGRAAQQ